jgi:tetratricopeptide (TPR) repeat protein
MPPTDFPAGYKPRHLLGEGSMGAVWLAYSAQARGHCAVKVLHLRDDRKGSAERSFNREVRAMARLSHPAVIEILDYGRTPQGSPFVTMEYVPGVSLGRYVSAPWTWARLWSFLDQLLDGLAHAHARDLVHRDLKPGNVLVVPDRAAGGIKLVDFGIALAATEASTASRRIEGTPAYIAPEAASGEVANIGPWTDLYSLGVMLFEIVSGELPFHGRHLLAHHQRTPLPPIKPRADVEVPPAFIGIIERLLAKSPVARLRTVADLRDAIERAGVPTPSHVAQGQPPAELQLDEDDTNDITLAEPLQDPAGAAGPGLFFLREPRLAGRERELELLNAAAEAALAGEGPRGVLIEGDAGLGKSRLAAWARERVEESGRMRALVIRSEPHTRAGGGLRAAVLRSLGMPTATRAEFEQHLPSIFSEADAQQNALDVLFGTDPSEDQTSDAHVARAARLVRDLAGGRPFVLWADDSQWSPEGKVLRLVHRLLRPDGPRHLLVLVTLRPSARTTVRAARRALLTLPNVQSIQLGPVNPLELSPALEELAPLPDGLSIAASLQAAGNPLIALEAVRSYLEDTGLSSVPTDPNAVLQARIDSVTKGQNGGALRSALARATLLGRSFTISPLAHLCAVSGDLDAEGLTTDAVGLEALLETAVGAGVLVEQGPGRWRFSHDLVRGQLRQVCRQLPNWAELNRVAAELKHAHAQQDHTGIELEVVARHCADAGQLGTALNLGRESLARLHGSGLMGHAASFVRRVLEWDDLGHLLSAEERADLCLLASEAAEHAGQPDEAERYARQAVDISGRNYAFAVGARASARLGELDLRADRIADAETRLEEALRFARRSGQGEARAHAHLALARFYQHTRRFEQAHAALEASLESARGESLKRLELEARSVAAHLARLEGRVERAEDDLTRIAAEAQQGSFEVTALTARLQLGLCAWSRADPVAAKAQFEEVRQGAHGNLFALEFYASLGEAWALAAMGDWAEVEMLLVQAEDLKFDVRIHDPEAERLRRALRELSQRARRNDLVERIERLDILTTKTHSTTHGADAHGD